MAIFDHKRLRKKLRIWMYAVLRRLFKATPSEGKINPDDIKRILLVRINYRIGNIIFLTPLIKALGKVLPHAKVDVIVGAEFTRSMLTGLDNVGEVYDAPRSLLKNPLRLIREIRRINSEKYDLAINVTPLSSTNSLVTALLNAPRKLGFDDDQSWVPLTHTVSIEGANPHMALKPLVLMTAFDGHHGPFEQSLDINLNEQEQAAGKVALSCMLTEQGYVAQGHKLVGIFRIARNNKIIPDPYWEELILALQKLDDQLEFIDIVVPDQSKLSMKLLEISNKDLRKLGGMLSQLEAFVCADTGPMHLASASGVPTIALFNQTRPARYGTLGREDLSLEIKGLDVQTVAGHIDAHLKTTIRRIPVGH